MGRMKFFGGRIFLHRKSFSALVLIFVLALSFGSFGISARAANVSSFSDTLSTSAPTIGAIHTLTFTTPTGISVGQNFVFTFPTGFVLTGVLFSDMALTISGASQTLAALASGTTWGAVVSGQTVVFTSGTNTALAGAVIIARIGGTNKIVNPTTIASYRITLSGSIADTGSTMVAIVNTVTMTASVDTTFTFTITGVASGQASANSEASPAVTSVTTTATSIPWGLLTPGATKTARQDIAVATNAQNGFTVTIQQNQPMTSGTGAVINNFKDGASTTPPTAWTAPSATIGNSLTYGHLGVTSESTINSSEFISAKYAGNINSARAIFTYSGPSNGTTQNVGATKIGFKIEISALQAAGNDYTNVLTYIATPVF